MRFTLLCAVLLFSFSAFAHVSCEVTSREDRLEAFEIDDDAKDAQYFFEVNQIKYRVAVLSGKEITVRIMNDDASQIYAESIGSKVRVSTGLDINPSKRLLTVSCESIKKRPSFEGRNFSLFRL